MEEQLKEMLGKRPDELEGETLKLFEAIMKIVDARDEYKKRCEGALCYIEDRIDNMIPEHYEDLHYILSESEEGEW